MIAISRTAGRRLLVAVAAAGLITVPVDSAHAEPGPNQPPEVTLTAPTDGEIFLYPEDILLAADATDPDGLIDRVEFYVEGRLVGTARTAPYEVRADLRFLCICTAFARAFDVGSPPASTDSGPASFNIVEEIPPLEIIMDPTELVIEAGSQAVVNVAIGAETTAEIEMSVSGDPGITVWPESFILDSGNWDTGRDVMVSADAHAAGATATIAATEVNGFESIPVTVVG